MGDHTKKINPAKELEAALAHLCNDLFCISHALDHDILAELSVQPEHVKKLLENLNKDEIDKFTKALKKLEAKSSDWANTINTLKSPHPEIIALLKSIEAISQNLTVKLRPDWPSERARNE